MKLVRDLGFLFLLFLLCTDVNAQTIPNSSTRQAHKPKLNYYGCWSGANRMLTHILFKGNTVQDTVTRKVFHFVEVSRDYKNKTVVLYIKDEIPSRRRFEIQFVSIDEILIGMPMFRDTCKNFPVYHGS